jgi:hypothetical protein
MAFKGGIKQLDKWLTLVTKSLNKSLNAALRELSIPSISAR